MEDLHIRLVQTRLVWENHKENRDILSRKLEALKKPVDLVVLPEMFTTGFSMNPSKLAEKMEGSSIGWMREISQEKNITLTGSLIIEEEGKYYNRLIWMRPDGSFEYYDKRHLFSLAKEDEAFTAGDKKLIVECKGWKICPLICYDLRFPVWARNVENYDVLLYTANFPTKRRYAWRHLLRARAIENQCYVLGINIVGADGNGFEYSGDTSVINPMGRLEKEVTDKEAILSATLEYSALENVRKSLPFLNDKDDFSIAL